MAAYTTIDDPSAYFKVQLYTGTGSSNAQTFADTDTDMQPDMVWIKSRSDEFNHMLYDSVRGVQKHIKPDGTNAEATDSNALTAFGSDGFTVGSNTDINNSSDTYVAWCWKAGTTSGITTNGSTDITPSAYSFNQTSGFSIIKYTGDDTNSQVAHGLGAVPKTIIIKQADATRDWAVYNVGVNGGSSPEDYGLELSDQTAQNDDNGWWNDTAPDSVNITVGRDSRTNGHDTGTYIGYCFADKQGFSKFGSYTGNGNADGPFVYTGFRPALVIIKNISATQNWTMNDNKRLGYNPDNNILFPNTNGADHTGDNIDLLSNGFKIRWDDGVNNTSGENFIYMAWAEAPFVNSNGVPCNAR